MTTTRKTYTEEFKREAVRLAKQRGSIAQTARVIAFRHGVHMPCAYGVPHCEVE